MTKKFLASAALLLLFLAPHSLRAANGAANSQQYGANFFSNATLVTQDGKQVQFYNDLLKDKKVLIDFIYASCTQSCPMQTAKLRQIQKALGSRVGQEIFIYSITLDPEHDTPAVLKAYASRFSAGPGWLFLTGKREDIDLIRKRLGERGDKADHGNAVRVGNVAAGQWHMMPLEADVNYIVNEVGKQLIPNWYANQPLKSYDEAPRLEVSATKKDAVIGQMVFRGECSGCHTIGAGERIGPDLKGVTERRKHDWLVRYLLAPDRMLASKDPIAVELAKGRKVPMPNLGLNHEQVDELLAYLAMQTTHPEPTAAAQAAEKKR